LEEFSRNRSRGVVVDRHSLTAKRLAFLSFRAKREIFQCEGPCQARSLFDRGQDFSSLALVAMTGLALVEMTFHSTLKEPLSNPWEPLNDPRCFTNLFRYSSAVNGYGFPILHCEVRLIARCAKHGLPAFIPHHNKVWSQVPPRAVVLAVVRMAPKKEIILTAIADMAGLPIDKARSLN